MTSIVTDFKSIKRKLDRQEQKLEFEEKNPKPAAQPDGFVVWTPEWGYGATTGGGGGGAGPAVSGAVPITGPVYADVERVFYSASSGLSVEWSQASDVPVWGAKI